MGFLIIIILLFIIGLGYVLYKILKEEAENIMVEKEEEKKKEKVRKKTYIEQANEKGFDTVLNEIKTNPNEVENLKNEIQIEVRKALKKGESSRVRDLNSWLKKIDEI